MTTQLERLDQSFAVVSTDEAREILGGMAEEFDAAGGKTFSGSDTNTTSGGTTTVDKTVDDEWS